MDLSTPLPTEKDIPPNPRPQVKSPFHLVWEWRRQIQLYPGRMRWKLPFSLSEAWGEDEGTLPLTNPSVFFTTPRGWWMRVKGYVGYSLSGGQQSDMDFIRRVYTELSITYSSKEEEVKKKGKYSTPVEGSGVWGVVFSHLMDEPSLIEFLKRWEEDMLRREELYGVLRGIHWLEGKRTVLKSVVEDSSSPNWLALPTLVEGEIPSLNWQPLTPFQPQEGEEEEE